MHRLYMCTHAQTKNKQATHATQKQTSNMYIRTHLHVYDIMHTLHMCKHAQDMWAIEHNTTQTKEQTVNVV